MLKKLSSKSTRFKVLLAIGVIVVAGGVAAFAVSRQSDQPKAPKGVKLAPATDEEKKAADDTKDRIVAQQKNGQAGSQSNQSTTASGKKQVEVLISSADKNQVRAYATGIFENGGQCTATFTQGSTTVTRTSAGFENVSYTQCEVITPSLPNDGAWSVVVTYSSAQGEGRSQAQTL